MAIRLVCLYTGDDGESHFNDGQVELETRLGERFTVAPGDVVLAEDTTGGGHRWRLVDDQPWRRVYVPLR
jgi:uncharacterized cupin superfamily protein